MQSPFYSANGDYNEHRSAALALVSVANKPEKLTQHNLTQHGMLPQHPISTTKLISDYF